MNFRKTEERSQGYAAPPGRSRSFWAAGFFAVLVFVGVVLCFQLLDDDVERWLESFKDQPLAVPLLAGLYVFKAVTVIVVPQPLTYLLTGLLFSPVPAFLLTLVFLSGEMALDYFLGRRFGKQWLDRLQQWLQGRSRFLDKMLNGNHLQEFLPLYLLRLMPGIPNDPVSLLAGAREAPFGRYFAASLLGAAPKAVAMTLMGSAVHDPLSPRFWVPLLCLAVVFIAATAVKKKLTKPKEETEDDSTQEAG